MRQVRCALAPAGQGAYVPAVAHSFDFRTPPAREPVFNIPGVVAALVLLMVGIEFVRAYVLDPDTDLELLAWFAFVPIRYDGGAPYALPGGLGAQVWTFVTYALLHANWIHVGVNSIWMLAFASPVARRFGTVRFLLFFVVTAVAGAAAHLLAYPEGISPMIGASAVVSGAMAAAVRFAFAPGGALGPRRSHYADHQPAMPLSVVLRDRRVLVFIGVFVLLNFLFGAGMAMPGTEGAEVAWQAHLGGFAAGLLLFPLFDPVPNLRGASPRA